MRNNTFMFSIIGQVEALLVIEAKGTIMLIGIEIIRLCNLIIRVEIIFDMRIYYTVLNNIWS